MMVLTDSKKGSSFFWDVTKCLLALEDGTERLFRNVGNYLLNSVALIPHNSEDITPRGLLKSRIDREEIAASVLTVENTVKDCEL
jgi:regulator of sirC expression with transglutaminase-like and TPR domain